MRHRSSLLVAGVALAAGALACGLPTEACGCSPAPALAVVTGTLRDAAGAPLAGARVSVAPSPQSAARPGVALAAFTTAADGAFGGPVPWYGAPISLALDGAVTRAGAADTAKLALGTVRFRPAAERPDTLRVALRLP